MPKQNNDQPEDISHYEMPSSPTNRVYTFLIFSDVHAVDHRQDGYSDWYEKISALISQANSVSSLSWPSSISSRGAVGPLLFATVNGDCVDGGEATEVPDYARGQWESFINFFARSASDASITMPCFIGLGNHDIDWEALFTDIPYIARESWYQILRFHGYYRSYDGITATPYQKVSSIDGDYQGTAFGEIWEQVSGNYVIEFNDIAFIQLHRFADDTKFGRVPGIEWLSNKLENLGSKPIVIFQHQGWDDYSVNDQSNVYTQAERDDLIAALDGYYVLAIFTAHQHGWQVIANINGTGISDYCSAAAKDGNVSVCCIDLPNKKIDYGALSLNQENRLAFNEQSSQSSTLIKPPAQSLWLGNSGSIIDFPFEEPWTYPNMMGLVPLQNGILLCYSYDFFDNYARDVSQNGTTNWQTYYQVAANCGIYQNINSGGELSILSWEYNDTNNNVTYGVYLSKYGLSDDPINWINQDRSCWLRELARGSEWNTQLAYKLDGTDSNIFYAVGSDNTSLYWFGFDDSNYPTVEWNENSGPPAGSGQAIFSIPNGVRFYGGSNGVFLSIESGSEGEIVKWYRDLAMDGTVNWHPSSGTLLTPSTAWPSGTSTRWLAIQSDGIVYRFTTDGTLYWAHFGDISALTSVSSNCSL